MTWIRSRWCSWICALLCGWFVAHNVPSRAFRSEASGWQAGEQRQVELARSVNSQLPSVAPDKFSTGSALFDGEWAFGTGVMAAIGNAQLALQSPESRASCVSASDRALAHITSWEIRGYDRDRWGSDPLDAEDSGEAHLAYLGYLNLALSLRYALSRSSHDALGERITDRLAAAYESSPGTLLETYPGEYYPMDNAMAVASIALRGRVDRARGKVDARSAQRMQIGKRWATLARARYLDQASGLLLQHSAPQETDAQSTGSPRGSGSAFAAFALNYVDDELFAELQRALRAQLLSPVLGFGLLQEFPSQVPRSERHGDIDSGPLVFGYSISASGFMVGASRATGDDASVTSLMAMFDLLGGLERRESAGGVRLSFVSGGPLADAIMLAMLTAPLHQQIDSLLEASAKETP
ncbi:MAG: hypothetical protein R3B07_22050 [Polyangiaceae bacterium]